MSPATLQRLVLGATLAVGMVCHVWAGVSVVFTAPANQSIHTPGGNITLTATASASGGYTVSKVEFFRGTTLIGTDTTAPYSTTWTNVPAGPYVLTARATAVKNGSPNQTATSSSTPIFVSIPPIVTLVNPVEGAVLGGSVTLQATASDSDGTVARVEFIISGTNGAENFVVTESPYTAVWTPSESYPWPTGWEITVLVYDNHGAYGVFGPVNISTIDSAPPSVSITSPSQNATFSAPAAITLQAQATDTDGTISSVEFYRGTTLITTVTSPPYAFNWTGVPGGTYSLTARAIDNLGGAVTSPPVVVTVNAAPALYFVHVDHLNTPRAIYDANQQLRWKWEQQEPFGVNVPDENPSSLGAFEFNLRFPGQYFDKETNTRYNGARNFDPAIGRFTESDPLGMEGGVNTYLYALGTPLVGVDPFGLITCIRNPPNFNSANCVLLSRSASDRDELGPEQATDEKMVDRTKLPDYRWSDSGSRPDRKQYGGGKPIRPTYKVVGHFVIETWYTQYTVHRRVITDFTELWRCSGPNACGPNDPTHKVVETCIGDWVPHTTRTNFWWRKYYEPAQ